MRFGATAVLAMTDMMTHILAKFKAQQAHGLRYRGPNPCA